MNRLIAEIKAFAGYIQEKIGERPTLTPLEVDAHGTFRQRPPHTAHCRCISIRTRADRLDLF